MHTTNHTEIHIQILQQEYRAVEECRVQYTFYQIFGQHTHCYAVEISMLEENDMRILGTDTSRAQRLFEILVNETVTPCTLKDVLRDAEDEEEQSLYRQNLCQNRKRNSLQIV